MTGIAKHAITIVLESPFATQGLEPSAWGTDASLARDNIGRLILPQGLVRGVLKHVVDELSEADAKRWFGSGAAAGDYAPQSRGCLFFADLVLADEKAEKRASQIVRIAIEKETGAVKEAHLQVVEMPFTPGTAVTFKGEIAVVGEAAERARIVAWLDAALKALPAIGAFKSAGFGRVIHGDGKSGVVATPVSTAPLLPDAAAPAPAAADWLALTLRFDRPFVVDAERVAGNVFVGSDVVPGAVVRGGLAERLKRAGVADADPLWDALSRMRVTHAFPAAADAARPKRAPLSLYATGKASEQTLAFHDALSGNRPAGAAIPRFSSDWKGEGDMVKVAHGWPETNWAPRTRTAIAAGYGSAADEMLFSHAAVVPDGRVWRARARRGEGVAEDSWNRLVAILKLGLFGVGKTDAFVTVTADRGALPAAAANADGLWRVTLETPAWIVEPEPGTVDMKPLYQAYFARALKIGTVELVDFYASQRRAGGYLASRYKRNRQYQPYVLTEAGSTFLLKAPGATAASFEPLLRDGLPTMKENTFEDWAACPFLPENGFGEIRVEPYTIPPTLPTQGGRS